MTPNTDIIKNEGTTMFVYLQLIIIRVGTVVGLHHISSKISSYEKDSVSAKSQKFPLKRLKN